MTISFLHKPNSVYEVPFEFGEAFYQERNNYEARIQELISQLATLEASISDLALCEATRLVLKPNRLYRFTVAPSCEACEAAALNAQ